MIPPEKNTGSLGDFDVYAHSYDAAVNGAIGIPGLSVDFFTAAKIDYIKALLAEKFGPTAKPALLDVGCGVGNYHPFLKDVAGRISGIDVSAESLAEAGKRNPGVEYRRVETETLPYETGSFDFAFAICVLHHVPIVARQNLVNEVRRVLRPGGWFANFEHNPLNPLTMRVVNRCPFDADAILLKEPESRALLNDAGFTKVKSRFILTVPMKGKLQGIDRLFGGLPLGSQYMTFGQNPAAGA